MLKNKKIKIVATLGPSSQSSEIIKDLALAGVDVFRLNLSHQKKENIKNIVKIIRETEKKLAKPLSIMGDLGGLKVRIGRVKENTVLKNGETIKISTEQVENSNEVISINYPSLISQFKKGTQILIDDGLIKLVITKELSGKFALAKVEVGGVLLSNKGFFAQGISLSSLGLPQKDIDDIKLMVDLDADSIAASFVQSDYDIMQIKEKLPSDSDIVIISKIETKLAIDNIEKIIEVSDGIMIARGDLGLAMPIAQVPLLQKKLISLCLKNAKPVITATQMLESMTKSPFPTRAEVADVANAILDGTDAIMLSGETASGKYPVEAVNMMSQVIDQTSPYISPREFNDQKEVSGSVSSAAGLIASKVGAKLILAFTQSGFSALEIARHRYPQEVIVGLSPNQKTLRKLNFCWGVYPKYIKQTLSFDHALQEAKEFLKNNDIIKLKRGEPYVLVTGLPLNQTGVTNLIHVITVE
jgi:pyruvate kinase